MTLPSNVGTGTVIGTYAFVEDDGTGHPKSTPAAGTLTFTPGPKANLNQGATTPVTLFIKPVPVTLDETGSFSVDLIATDDTDLNPSAWTWTVSFNLTGVTKDSFKAFSFSLPENTTVDLTAVAPVPSATGTATVRGIGVPDPSTGVDGDAIVLQDGVPVWSTVSGVGGDGGTPGDGTVTNASIADDAAIDPSKIAGLATVATTGDYSDLTDKPALAAVATTGAYSDLTGAPSLATVATSGSYADLSATPDLATVATTGAYSDLSGTPDLSGYATTAALATVATSGSYADLTSKPTAATIGAAAVDEYGHIASSALPVGLSMFAVEASGTYPSDPNPSGMTVWIGADNPGPGGLGLMKDADLWMQVAA